MEHITSAGSGAIVGVEGLEEAVLKTATLNSLSPGDCLPLRLGAGRLGLEQDAIVKVAVEPNLPQDMRALQEGLRRLNQADPAVDTYVAANGQHVVAATGELHLERCLRDLKERYSPNIYIHVSAPIVSFRETVVGIATADKPQEKEKNVDTEDEDEENGERSESPMRLIKNDVSVADVDSRFVKFGAAVEVKGNDFSYRVAVAALPNALTEALDKSRPGMLSHLSAEEESWLELESVKHKLKKALRQEAKRQSRPSLREECFQHWENLLDRVWSSGPRQFGPNLLFGPGRSRGLSSWMKKLFCMDDENQLAGTAVLQECERVLATGFQLALDAGPLCEEPLSGVAVFVDNVVIHEQKNSDEDVSESVKSATSSAWGAQVMTTFRGAIRLAMSHSSPRLVEPVLKVEISVTAEALGSAYTVLLKRRGTVLKEEIKEGVNVFAIQAHLPVVESFGFADILRRVTSGLAAPQFSFGGWKMVEQDPFWIPTTEEEIEDIGLEDTTEVNNNLARKLVNKIRRSKGLRVEEKTVEKAEKQRTRSRKK